MPDRKANFELAIPDYDAKALGSAVDFTKHRYISVERDDQNTYVKGHTSQRAACDHMARAVEEGEPYVPGLVIDLDTGSKAELDLFVFVAPKNIEAVAVMMPREMAITVNTILKGTLNTPALEAPIKLIQQAIDRRN